MRSWIKVHRPRAGSRFEAEVSGPARMLFRGLLAYGDERGRIHLTPEGELHNAVGRLLGYDGRERRMLRKQLEELLTSPAAGIVLCHDEGRRWLLFPNFGAHQGHPQSPKPDRTRSQHDHNSDTRGALKGDYVHPEIPNGAEHDHSNAAKCPESPSRVKTREDQIRPEERENARPRAGPDPPPPPDPQTLREADIELARVRLIGGYGSRFEAQTGEAWTTAAQVEQHIRDVARWVASNAPRRGTTIEALAVEWLDCVFRKPKLRANRWPWHWLSRDPGRELQGAEDPAVREARELREHNRRKRERDERERAEWRRRTFGESSDVPAQVRSIIAGIAPGRVVADG